MIIVSAAVVAVECLIGSWGSSVSLSSSAATAVSATAASTSDLSSAASAIAVPTISRSSSSSSSPTSFFVPILSTPCVTLTILRPIRSIPFVLTSCLSRNSFSLIKLCLVGNFGGRPDIHPQQILREQHPPFAANVS